MKYLSLVLILFTSLAHAQPLRELPSEPPAEAKAVGSDLGLDVLKVWTPTTTPIYNQVPVTVSGGNAKHYDVTIFTIWKGELILIDVVETKTKGKFVFTGPPGRYTIRVSAFDPDNGFTTVTTSTELVGPGPVSPVDPPVDPTEPPIPVDPNTPSTGPPPEGYTGLGPLVYDVLVKDRPDVRATKQLASNFEWAASVKGVELPALIGELKKRNEAVYSATPGLASFKKAWTDHVNRQIQHGILLPDITEHQRAYAETAAGIRAAYGK